MSFSCSTDADLGKTRWVSAWESSTVYRHVPKLALAASVCRHTSSKPISKRHSTAPLMGSSLVEKVGLPIRMDLYFSS